MKKSRLLGAVCAYCLIAFQPVNAALLTGVVDNGNFVGDYCPGCPGIIDFEIDYFNLAPVELTFDPLGAPFEDIHFLVFNVTGIDWTDFHIAYVPLGDPFAPKFFDVPFISPFTDPLFTAAIGVSDFTGLPDSIDIFFNTPESIGLEVGGFLDQIFDPISSFKIILQPTVVPIPAAVWLFGSGLLGLVGIARRKKAA